jgi:hypothetical protein
MKNLIFFTALLGFLFIGCSDGQRFNIAEEQTDVPSDNTDDTTTDIADEVSKNIKVALCEDNNNTVIQSGDKVQKIADDTEVEIIHSESGDKSICVKTGEAELIRE